MSDSYKEEEKVIRGIIADLSRGILQDDGHIPSNCRQALNLFQVSGLGLDGFRELMRQAEHVLKLKMDKEQVRIRAAFFFRVLSQLSCEASERAMLARGRRPYGASGQTAGDVARSREQVQYGQDLLSWAAGVKNPKNTTERRTVRR